MYEITETVWHRQGCSLVWEKELLLPLLRQQRLYPLREALLWLKSGFPSMKSRQPVVVAGLQTCLELLPTPDEARDFLRIGIQPLIRRWQDEFTNNGLVFGLNCDEKQWSFDGNECGILAVQGNRHIPVVASLWNGAARDAGKLIYERQSPKAGNKPGKVERIFGGLYVRRLS